MLIGLNTLTKQEEWEHMYSRNNYVLLFYTKEKDS